MKYLCAISLMLYIGWKIGADPDTITLCAFLAAATINRYALLFVFAHLFNEAAFALVDGGIYYNLSSGIAYALIGALFINLSYKLRQVFILIGALFWLSAVDFYLLPATETMFYNSFAYIVGAVDLYALLLLLYGGRRFDRIDSSASSDSNFRLPDLQLLQARIKKNPR